MLGGLGQQQVAALQRELVEHAHARLDGLVVLGGLIALRTRGACASAEWLPGCVHTGLFSPFLALHSCRVIPVLG